MVRTVGNSKFQKSANDLLIMNLLRKGPVSRVELARLTGLQQSTVTYCIQRLRENGIVYITGEAAPHPQEKAGRRPMLVALNPEAGCVAGIELLAGMYRIVISDICGSDLYVMEEGYRLTDGVVSAGALFESRMEEAVEKARILCSGLPLRGICLALPGIVSAGGSHIVDCWTHGLTGYDMDRVFSRYPFPLWLENDANCCAFSQLAGQSSLPSGSGHDSFIYFLFRSYEWEDSVGGMEAVGMGAGLVLEGHLYKGFQGRAGEFRSRQVHSDVPQNLLSAESVHVLRLRTGKELSDTFRNEVIDSLWTTWNLCDPRCVFIGGFDTVDINAMRETLDRRYRTGLQKSFRAACIFREDSRFDACRGAALLVMETLFQMPRVGENAHHDTPWWHGDSAGSGVGAVKKIKEDL